MHRCASVVFAWWQLEAAVERDDIELAQQSALATFHRDGGGRMSGCPRCHAKNKQLGDDILSWPICL